jgi:HAE1 family hydrophobic/amphiphilic exporter-1
MNLTRFLVGRPWLTAMPFGAVALMGAVSLTQLPVSDMPSVTWPGVIVMTSSPGTSATAVKHDVTDKLEDAISELGSIKKIVGVSATGSSTLQIELTSDTDVDIAAADITQAISGVKDQLPKDAGSSRIMKFTFSSGPVLVANFTGADLSKISDVLEHDVAPVIRLVEGAGSVSLTGNRPTVSNVVLDPDRLTARGLTVAQVTTAIQSGNRSTDAGAVDAGGLDSSVRLTDRAATSAELGRVVVGSSGGSQIRLADVAKLKDAPEKATSDARMDGNKTVSLSVTPKSGANVVEVADGAKKALDKLKAQLPSGTVMTITDDRSIYIKDSVTATAMDLVLAVLLASLVVLIFLQSFRQTIIVLFAIPTSLLATSFMMNVMDFSIDIVSLLAMSLLIGILVDDAVVVLENITRHLAMGKSLADAAVEGRTEIGGAAVALTLVDVVVFLPIAVSGGIMSDILIELAMTIVVATLFSLFVSFTLTPMLAARWLKHVDQDALNPLARLFNRAFGALERGYVRVLRTSLRHRLTVLIVGTCCLFTVVGLISSGKIPVRAQPDVDTNQLSAVLTMPSGSTLDSRGKILADISRKLKKIPDVVMVYGRTGEGEVFRGTSAAEISMTVKLTDKNSRSESLDSITKKISDELERVPGGQSTVSREGGSGGASGGTSVDVELTGPGVPVLEDLSRDMMTRLKKNPKLTGVTSDLSDQTPSWEIDVDSEKATRLGVSTDAVMATVAAVTKNISATSTLQTASGLDQDVLVSLATNDRGVGIEELKALPVAVQPSQSAGGAGGGGGGAGGTGGAAGAAGSGGGSDTSTASRSVAITLGQVATVRRGSSPARIIDIARQPRVLVSASGTIGMTTADVQTAMTQTLKGFKLPPGYAYSFGGSAESEGEMFQPLLIAIGMAPPLIYMLLAALYESLVLPFVVILAMPLAVIGALLALLIGGTTINIFSMIGMVLLIGLVSKNGILLIDRTEQKRKEGLSAVEALAEAGRVRLRPILMTTMTLVMAMMPIALSHSSGSEERAPLALVLIGGMSSSTLLTLLIVPTLYTLLDGMRERMPRALRGLLHGRVPGPVGRFLRGRRSDAEPMTEAIVRDPDEPTTLPGGVTLDLREQGKHRKE